MQIDKATLAGGKMREAARTKMRVIWRAMVSGAATLRPYFDRLRPYLDKLRSYANRLQRYAIRAVDAVGRWLHRGIVQVGKVSPRAAKWLEAGADSGFRCDRRKLC